MSEFYMVKMIYKGKEITRKISVHWSMTLEFTLSCLYPGAKILSFEKVQ
jgi:hypothetical protein